MFEVVMTITAIIYFGYSLLMILNWKLANKIYNTIVSTFSRVINPDKFLIFYSLLIYLHSFHLECTGLLKVRNP